MDKETIIDTSFDTQDDAYNKSVHPVAPPTTEIGIDRDNTILSNIESAGNSSSFDVNALNSFTQISRNRNEIYDTLDDMSEDSTLSAVLETYTEDATETNDSGHIMWAESNDALVLKFITYLLDSLNVDKNIYDWTFSLCKYGDVYLRLYRESEYDSLLFDSSDKKSRLNEDIKINAYSKHDKYVHYLEKAVNPAQLFELTKFGKTTAYIKTQVEATQRKASDYTTNLLNKYSFNKNDVDLFPPTEFVHGCLVDNSSRIPEEVDLFVTNDKKLTYNVKRGQSLLYSTYKVWRQLMLLENSILLNRVTQSSIVRVIGVEVGNMPKENVEAHLLNIKQLIEQKASLDVNNSMGEYNNPGPIINNVYIPTRNNQGSLSTQQIGGEVKVGELTDLDYYVNKLFSNLRVPKQFFSFTSDAAGFSGGQSLALISSRYAKMIKRIQNVMCQVVTDAINLILIDTGNEAYINKFTLKMQAPTTQEEVDKLESQGNKITLVRDIMDTLQDIDNPTTKLKVLKSLLSSTISDTEVITLIQDEIDSLETQQDAEKNSNINTEKLVQDTEKTDSSEFPDDAPLDIDLNSPPDDLEKSYSENKSSEVTEDESNSSLPSPDELNVGDFSDLTNPDLT